MSKRVCALVSVLATVVLASCGGGGGGGGNSSSASPSQVGQQGSVTLVFDPSSVDATAIEGAQTTVSASASAKIQAGSNQEFWVGIEQDSLGVIANVDQNFPTYDTYTLGLTLKGDLPAGTYDTGVVLHLCADEGCNKELSGSPVRVPLHYVVKPNIKVQSTVSLARAGRDAAPSQTVTLTVPAEAGAVTAQMSTTTPEALSATLSGTQLTVQTTQVKAGTYTGTVYLQGQSDSRYRNTVSVTYTVNPPVGGEVPLSVDPPSLWTNIQQGKMTTARFKVVRPSWTSQWTPPTLLTKDSVYALRDLGNDEYEVQISGVNASVDLHESTLRFDAGPTGGTVDVRLDAFVNGVFAVGKYAPMTAVAVTEASTDVDLTQSMSVKTYDGGPSTWTATAKVPWLTLIRSSGTAGVDDLLFKVDKTFLLQQHHLMSANAIDVAINRPGILPVSVQVNLLNEITQLQRASSGTLMGTSGRVYVTAGFDPSYSPDGLLANGYLTVSGATVAHSAVKRALRLDVSGAQAGQPLTVAIRSALDPNQIQIKVANAIDVPAGYLALPFASYRPAQYVPGLHALYWSGGGRVFRWSHEGGSWFLSQVAVDGLADMAVSLDETRLYVVASRTIQGFDPETLSFINQGAYSHLYGVTNGVNFDAQTPAGMRALAFLVDGSSFASVSVAGAAATEHGALRIGGGDDKSTGISAWDLAVAPHELEGSSFTRSFAGLSIGSGLVVSPGAQNLLTVDPDGKMRSYDVEVGLWFDGGAIPAGLLVAALSDDGKTFVRSDGVVQIGGNVITNPLSDLLPASQIPGGYGLTPDGRYALIYAYKMINASTGASVQDAKLWVVDLQGATISNPQGARLTSVLGLQGAVGCTGPLATGETCRHTAQVLVDPSGQSVFVLGPRAVTVASLSQASPVGSTVAAAARASGRMQIQSVGSATARRWKQVIQVRTR